MTTEKQITARKRNFVKFLLSGMFAMIKRIKKESNFDNEFHMAIDQIITSLEVILSGNVSAWNWIGDDKEGIAVQKMSESHIRICIHRLEHKNIFSKPIERALWICIFKTELIKRNQKSNS